MKLIFFILQKKNLKIQIEYHFSLFIFIIYFF